MSVLQFEEDSLKAECHLNFDTIDTKNSEQPLGNRIKLNIVGSLNEVLEKRKIEVIKQQIRDGERKINFTEKLWFCGKLVGEVTGTIKLINFPFICQLKLGIMTNQGIQFRKKPRMLNKANHIFSIASNSKN